MTDPDDLMLSALFRDADDDIAGVSGPVFTQHVMARVVDDQMRRKALTDSLWLAATASLLILVIVMLPAAWPHIQASLEAGWVTNSAAYGLNSQTLMLVTTLLLGAIGWLVAVKD